MSTTAEQEEKAKSSQPAPDGNTGNKEQSKPEEPKPAPPDPKKRGRMIFFGMIALTIAAVVGFFLYMHYSVIESTDDAEVDGHITPISPRISGTISEVDVDDNQPVQAGQVLAKIDPRDYQASLDRAKADLADAAASAQAAVTDIPLTNVNASGSLESARAGLGEAQAGYNASQSNVESAQSRVGSADAKVREAQANYDKAAKDLARYKDLVAKDEISRQQYDSVVAAAEAARATLESAQASASEARHAVSVAQANAAQSQAHIGQAKAQVAQASTVPQQVAVTRARQQSSAAKVQQNEAVVRQAELNVGYTVITAPVAGLVGRKAVEVGQQVQPGQQLMSIVPLDKTFITANFKETQLKKMRVGQPVDLKVDALGGRKYSGHVQSIGAATGARFSLLPPENATGNFVKVVQRIPVKIVLDKGQDAEHLLRPGMSVEPTVHTDVQPDTSELQNNPRQ